MKINTGNFDKKTSVDSHGKQDTIWRKKNILASFNTIRIRNPSFTITTDASTSGWGAVFKNASNGGQFNITQTLTHINVLELKAILVGLRSLCDHFCGSHIKTHFWQYYSSPLHKQYGKLQVCWLTKL